MMMDSSGYVWQWGVVAVVLLALAGCDRAGAGEPQDDAGVPDVSEVIDAVAEADDPIVLRGQEGVTIKGKAIRADLAIELQSCRNITLIDCDLTRVVASDCTLLRIINCYIHDSKGEAIYLDDCEDVLIQGNRFERVKTAVLAHQSSGIDVVGNFCRDVLGPLPGGQFVQFDKVTGPGNAITDNYALNDLGKSNPEDMISLYQSHGTKDSPILIEGNYLAGDTAHGSAGKSDSGSGIMLGDNGGSWQLCRNNTLISPGQVGIGVACGENITVEGNLILGKQSDVSNVGLYAWNQYENEPAGRVTFRNNTVAWVNSIGEDNPYWNGGGFIQVAEDNNILGGHALMETIEVAKPPSVWTQPSVSSDESER